MKAVTTTGSGVEFGLWAVKAAPPEQVEAWTPRLRALLNGERDETVREVWRFFARGEPGR